jgi:hypothetical protein
MIAVGRIALISYIDAAPPTPSSRFQVWSGTAWVAAVDKTWNGTAWVDVVDKVWNGSAWV